MVDAEGFAPAGDFFLHRHFVADDESVARHFFERHVRGRAFHAPRGVGIVFVFQRRAAFLHRGGVAGADIAFAGDRELGDRFAQRRQRVAIGAHQRFGRAQSGRVGDQPGVPDARGAFHRRFHQSRDPDRRPAWTERLQADAMVLHRIETSPERDFAASPQGAHQLDAFGETRRAFLERNAESVEFSLAIAQSDAEDEVAFAENVESRGFLGDVDGVEQRQQQDVAADGHAFGLG